MVYKNVAINNVSCVTFAGGHAASKFSTGHVPGSLWIQVIQKMTDYFKKVANCICPGHTVTFAECTIVG